MATRKKANRKAAKAKSKTAAKKSAVKKSAAKKSSKKVVRLAAKKPAAKSNGNGLPRPSAKPFGQAGRALEGIKILDFTHVQSGPTCTPAARLYGRRRDQGGTSRRRRHHAHAIARREGAGQPLLHHAQRIEALDHDRTPSIPRARKSSNAWSRNATCWSRTLRPAHSTAWG